MTDLGERQAQLMGRTVMALLNSPRDVSVIASPLGRAARTASIICGQLGIPPESVEFDDRLKEMSWGDYDGLTREEIRTRDSTFFDRRYSDHWNFVPIGGESYAVVASRIRVWLAALRTTGPTVVVTHGAASRILRGMYAGASHSQILSADEPQDAIFQLFNGSALRIPIVSSSR